MSLQNKRVSRKRLVRVRRTKGHRRKGGEGVSRLRQCKQLTFGLKRNMKKENKTFKGKHKCSKKKLGGENTINYNVYEYTSADADSFSQKIEELKAEQTTLRKKLTVSDDYYRGVKLLFRETFGAVLSKLTDQSMNRVWLIEQTVDGAPSFYIMLFPFVTTYCMQIGIFKTCQQKAKESSSDVLLPLRSQLQEFVYQTAKNKGFNYVLVCPLKSMYWKLLQAGFTHLELPVDKSVLKKKLREVWIAKYAQGICTLHEARKNCMNYLNTDVNIILDWIGEPEDKDTYYFYDDWDNDDSDKYLLRDPDKEATEKTPTQYLRDPDRQIWRSFKKNELVEMLQRILQPKNFPDSCRPVGDATATTLANEDKIVVTNIACRMDIFFRTLPVATPYLGSLSYLLVKKIDTDGARTPPNAVNAK